MSKREQTTAHILEILHPVLLTALVGPIIYCVYKKRVDAWVVPMYMLGLWLLPLSAAVRIAGRRIHNLFVFLAISAAVFAAVFLAGNAMSRLLWTTSGSGGSPGSVPSVIYTLEMMAGGIWIILGAVEIRLRENRRVRARLENDLTWQEKSIISEKPGALCLIFFLFAYLDGLLNACPPLCNIAIGSGLLYLAIVLIYRSIAVMREYVRETQSLANVPVKKISGIRQRYLAALLSMLCIVAIAAFLTSGLRIYRDLRTWELKGQRIEVSGEGYETQPSIFEVYDEEFGLGIAEHTDPPRWLVAFEELAAVVLPLALAAVLLLRIWRGITATAKDFSEIQEENGDIAVRLDSASDERGDLGAGRIRRFMRGEPLTEKEKIRREYRRTINRYRKDVPLRSETPSEIESGTQFPQDFDIKALHERYEQARYGN